MNNSDPTIEELRTKYDAEIRRMKRHPGYYWNYLILKLAARGWITVDTLNRLRWSIKTK